MLPWKKLAVALALVIPAAVRADVTLSGSFPDGTQYSFTISSAGLPNGALGYYAPSSVIGTYGTDVGIGYGYYTSGGNYLWTDWNDMGMPFRWSLNTNSQYYQVQYYGQALTGTWTVRIAETAAPYSVVYGYYTWDGTNATPYQTVSCPINYTFVSTSLTPQTVSVVTGSTTIATGTVQPYQTLVLTGTATGVAGTTSITANSAATLIPAAQYDPALINAMGTAINRTYYVGTDPSTMINCTIVVQAANSTTTNCPLTVTAGNLNLISATVPGGPLSDGLSYYIYKAALPLPVGATVAVSTVNHSTMISSPASSIVSGSNYDLLYVLQVDNSTNAPPASTATDNTTVTITKDGNGNPVSDTLSTPGTTGMPSGSEFDNLTTSPINGQVAQTPSVNGTPITIGTGTTTASGSGSGSSSSSSSGSTTTTTSSSTGSGGTTTVGIVNSALLQQIASNTATIAQEDAAPTGLQAFNPPSPAALTPFSPTLATGLSNLNPLTGYVVPTATAPVLTLPLSLLSSQMSDYSFDFAQGTPNNVAVIGRACFTFIVGCWFILHHIRLISRTFGV